MTDVVGRSGPTFAVDPRLRGRLAALAAGRILVIGYFASSRCGVVVGDLDVSWRTTEHGAGYMTLEPIEGVPIRVDRRLLDVLTRSAPELWPGGLLRRTTPSIRLALPEQWIAFLEGPTVMARREAP